MVRHYKKKSNRQKWSEKDVEDGIQCILHGEKIKTVAEKYGVPRQTLQRKFSEYKKNIDKPQFVYKQGVGFKTVFTTEQEQFLCNKILSSEERLHGFSALEVRRLAYDLAKDLKLPNNFNDDTCLAGLEWFRGFMKRHPKLSLRKPEPTSAARATGFNNSAVANFFNLLENLYKEYNFQASNIYNVDETGVSCNPKSHSRVVAARGKRQVGLKVSAERGETVTACVCFSASGRYMGPLLIYPRKKENKTYLEGAPPDAWAEFNQSGWMDESIFNKWLQKFIEFSNASKENPVLLLLDGHATHVKNLDAIKLAQEHGVVMLCFPPHCTHKMQPLDVSYMKPLSNYYSSAVNQWMREHPYSVIGLKDIFSIFGKAFLQASSMETAVNGFRKTGIFPFNPDVFKDEDFAATRAPSNTSNNVFNETDVTHTVVNVRDSSEAISDYLSVRESVVSVPSESVETFPFTSNNIVPMQTNNFTTNEPMDTFTSAIGNFVNDKTVIPEKENPELNAQNSAASSTPKSFDACKTSTPVNHPDMTKLKNDIMIAFEKSIDQLLQNVQNSSYNLACCEKKTEITKKRRAQGKAAIITTPEYETELVAAKAKRRKVSTTTAKTKKRNGLADITNKIVSNQLIKNELIQQHEDNVLLLNVPEQPIDQQIFLPVLSQPIDTSVQSIELQDLPNDNFVQYYYIP